MLLFAEIANGAIAAGQGQHLPVTLEHWVAFCVGTVILLALDMFVFHRDSHEPTLRESADVDAVLVHAGDSVQFVAVVVGGAGAAAGVEHMRWRF